MSDSAGAAGTGAGTSSTCVVLCSLKHGREQLGDSVRTCKCKTISAWTYYGSAQEGHLYFFGSELHTPQSTSVIPVQNVSVLEASWISWYVRDRS